MEIYLTQPSRQRFHFRSQLEHSRTTNTSQLECQKPSYPDETLIEVDEEPISRMSTE
jgi:hypothetical protein